jgi:hypothetical protein
MEAKLVYCKYTMAPINRFRKMMMMNRVRLVSHAKAMDLRATVNTFRLFIEGNEGWIGETN